MNLILKIFAVFVFFIFSERHSAAYLDPGTVTFVLQVIVAAVAAALVAVKVFWLKILAFFSGLFGKGRRSNKK